MSWEQVRRWRMHRNALSGPDQRTVSDLVADLGGMQAQVLSAAELGLGARLPAWTQRDVQQALWEQRILVKTYGPRGTLHLLPAVDLPKWMAAMRARQDPQGDAWQVSGIGQQQGSALVEAIGAALTSRCLTRQELADEVAARVGEWAREPMMSGWGLLLPPAAYAGLLCYGPSRGTKVTFVRADEWVPGNWECSGRAGLQHVLRCFLTGFGPATVQDFAKWFGLRPEQSRQLFESLDDLVAVDVEGRTGWLVSADVPAATEHRPAAPPRLLPQYDCYVLGSHPRDQILPAVARTRVFSYRRGRYEGAAALNVLVIDGRIAGIWERERRGRHLHLRLEPFVEIDQCLSDALAEQAGGIADFLESEHTLSIGKLNAS